MHRTLSILALSLLAFPSGFASAAPPNPLPNTSALSMDGDIADQMITGIHTFLDRQLAEQRANRLRSWPKPSSPTSTPLEMQSEYLAATKPLRESLAYRIGIREPRSAEPQLRVEGPWPMSPNDRTDSGLRFSSVCWNVFEDVIVHGICITPPSPKTPSAQAIVIAIPDAEQSPEQLCGQGPDSSAYAIDLCEQAFKFLCPKLSNGSLSLGKSDLS